MFKIIKRDAFFCHGKAFDQLIGVEPTREDAISKLAKLINENNKLKNYQIDFEEGN